jgi:nucleoside-diphosphate-sugar epimerase
MKVLLTGGAGYIGSVLIPQLLESGCAVTVLDNLRFGGHGLLPYFLNPRFNFIKGDVLDEKLMKDAIKDVDLIIHLAAIVGFPACKKEPILAEEVNFKSTQLINKLRNPQQPVIFASTNSNYGSVPEGFCTEETPLNPLTIYGKTKTASEKLLLESGNVVVYRFATAFGLSPRLRLDLLINDFVYQALKRNFILIYEKDFKRSFIHVRDIARAIVFAVDHHDQMKNEVYNVGSENMNISKKDLALMIKKHINYFLEFAESGEDPDKRNYEVSYEKIRKAGFHTTISLEKGIQELIRGLEVIEIQSIYSNV